MRSARIINRQHRDSNPEPQLLSTLLYHRATRAIVWGIIRICTVGPGLVCGHWGFKPGLRPFQKGYPKKSGRLVCRYVVFSLPQQGTRRPRRFLLTEGWMGWMGWMDGRSTFFFGPYLENYYIIFFNCFSSLKYMDLHIFWNIRRKKSEYSFFQNISPKSSPTFFSKIFSRISQFLENYSIYFPHCFWSP